MSPSLVRPGDVNLGIKPYPLMIRPDSAQVYFRNGLPCRCRLQIPIETDRIIDYLSELNIDQVLIPPLEPGLYQIGFESFDQNGLNTIRINPISILSQFPRSDSELALVRSIGISQPTV